MIDNLCSVANIPLWLTWASIVISFGNLAFVCWVVDLPKMWRDYKKAFN
jgi:hypothetical protein